MNVTFIFIFCQKIVSLLLFFWINFFLDSIAVKIAIPFPVAFGSVEAVLWIVHC